MVLERLNTRAALFVIALAVDKLPVELPLPIWSVPALMVVVPVYVFVPERICVPVPILASAPVPEITPA